MKRAWVVLASLGIAASCAAPHEEPEPKPVVTVKLADAELAPVRASVRAPALVHPRQQANVASRLTAVIKELRARKGDRVAEGATLARLDDRELQAQRAEALATLRQAEANTERRTRLFEEGAIPQRDLLATQTELAQAKARLELVETQVQYAELKSPFAGTLTEQFLYPGDMARPETPVFTIADQDVVVARAQVPEADAAALQPGLACAFKPTDRRSEALTGRVTTVNHAVDPGRRTVEAWCEIPNGAYRLLPGVFGELQAFTSAAKDSVVVPASAVELAEGTRKGTVLVVDDKKIAHRKEVEAGESLDDGRVQILEGLEAGEHVVVEGGYGVADGTAVRIADPEKDEKDERAEKKEKDKEAK